MIDFSMYALEELVDLYEDLHEGVTRMRQRQQAVAKELDKRAATPDKTEGTITMEVEPGVDVVITRRLNRTVSTADVERLGNQIEIDRYFTRKYVLDVKAYRKAPDVDRHAIAQAVTTKPGAPSVVIRRSNEAD